jgi:hypothetical protein
MPKTVSHDAEKTHQKLTAPSKPRRRRLSKESAKAFNVASFLNNCPYPNGKTRVLKIIDLLRVQAKLLDNPAVRKAGSIYAVAESSKVKIKFYAMHTELKSLLERYSFHPGVMPPSTVDSPWSPIWVPSYRNAQARKDVEDETLLTSADNLAAGMFTEMNGVSWVMAALGAGSLDRVTQCDHCQIWFGRKFIHQNFCSEKCRIAAFRATQEYKEKRNEYVRENYRLQRSGKVK